MRKLISSAIIVLLLTGCSFSTASNWAEPDIDSHYWSNAGGSGGDYYSSVVPQLHPHFLWSRNTHGHIMSDGVISPYKVVSLTNNASSGCTIFTLMLSSGRKDFCRDLYSDNAKNFPLADKFGDVYTGNHNQLLAYDWYGPLRWSDVVQGTPISSQFIAPDVLVSVTDSGTVYVCEAHLGKILAEINIHLLENETFSAPIQVDRKNSTVWINSNLSIYELKINPEILASNPAHIFTDISTDSRNTTTTSHTSFSQIHLMWQFHQATPIRQIIFSHNFHYVYLLSSTSLAQINLFHSRVEWQYDLTNPLGASMDLKGNIYVTSPQGILRINHISTLNHIPSDHTSDNALYTVVEKWYRSFNHIISHPIALSNGNILILTSQSHTGQTSIQLLCLQGETGKEISHENFVDKTANPSTHGEISIANNGIIIITLSDGEVLGVK